MIILFTSKTQKFQNNFQLDVNFNYFRFQTFPPHENLETLILMSGRILIHDGHSRWSFTGCCSVLAIFNWLVHSLEGDRIIQLLFISITESNEF